MDNTGTGQQPDPPDLKLRPWRIGICGSSDVDDENVASFCRHLGRNLAAETRRNIVIVSGGCLGKAGSKNRSVDWHVVSSAADHLDDDNKEKQHIETLLPGKDRKKIDKFDKGTTIKLHGKTPQARRFALASNSDVLVAINGGRGTQQHLDLSLALGRPILPVPFCGGRSRKCWDANKEIVKASFDIDEVAARAWEELDIGVAGNAERAASEIAEKLIERLRMRCMVIMPFSEEYRTLYESQIEPAARNAGFLPIRTDYLHRTGDIIEMIYRGIRNCDCAIVVIDGYRPNVMYELGLAHAYEKPTLLLHSQNEKLPFDIDNQNVIAYSNNDPGLQDKIVMRLEVARNTFSRGRMMAFTE